MPFAARTLLPTRAADPDCTADGKAIRALGPCAAAGCLSMALSAAEKLELRKNYRFVNLTGLWQGLENVRRKNS